MSQRATEFEPIFPPQVVAGARRWFGGMLARAAAKVSPATFVPSWERGRPVWNPWSFRRAIAEGYKAHEVVYAIVSRLAAEASSVPWVVTRGGRDEIGRAHV